MRLTLSLESDIIPSSVSHIPVYVCACVSFSTNTALARRLPLCSLKYFVVRVYGTTAGGSCVMLVLGNTPLSSVGVVIVVVAEYVITFELPDNNMVVDGGDGDGDGSVSR